MALGLVRWPQISAYQALRGKDQSVSFPVCHKQIHGPSAHDPVCGCEDGFRPRPAGPCWPCTQMLRSCQQAVKKDLNLLIFSASPPDQGSWTQEPAWATYMYGGSGRGWNGLKHVEGSHVPRRVWRVPASVPAVFRLMGSQ